MAVRCPPALGTRAELWYWTLVSRTYWHCQLQFVHKCWAEQRNPLQFPELDRKS